MFDRAAYLERADPRFAPAWVLALALALGPFIELDPGSNRPGRMSCAGRSAAASRFLAFFAAFAFARWRALALVMSCSILECGVSRIAFRLVKNISAVPRRRNRKFSAAPDDLVFRFFQFRKEAHALGVPGELQKVT